MGKMKIYLDTSTLSHLHQPDAPDKMQDTLGFWGDVVAGEYEIYISDTTTREVARAPAAKRAIMERHMADADLNYLPVTDETKTLAEKIIHQGILTRKSEDDCMHIAAALMGGCDAIVSWNFKHMVNVRTIEGVRQITLFYRYKPLGIYTPSMFLKGDA